MEGPNTSHPQKPFPLMRLPAEVRCKIYSYAVVRARPIELRIKYHPGALDDPSHLGRVRVYTNQDFRMLAVNRESRQEMTAALYDRNAFEIGLWREDAGEGVCLHQVDLRRIRKCRLVLHDMETGQYHPHRDVWGGSFPFYWHHHLRALVATLVFHGHQMRAVLVECQQQNPVWLLECLRPMAMLRQFGLVHFRFRSSDRSSSPDVRSYFRFLEARITSNRAVPFRSWEEFRDQTAPLRPRLSTRDRRRNPPPRTTDMTGEGAVKSEAELEDAAKTLYAILGIQEQMRP